MILWLVSFLANLILNLMVYFVNENYIHKIWNKRISDNYKRIKKWVPVIISILINCSSIERIFRSLFSTTMSPTKGSWGRHTVFFMFPLIIKSGIRFSISVWFAAEPSALTRRFFCIRKSPYFLIKILNDDRINYLRKVFMSQIIK